MNAGAAARISDITPEIEGSAFASASVRPVMDMSAGPVAGSTD